MKTKDEALSLLHEYTKTESLLKHATSVAQCMVWYGKKYEISEPELTQWEIAGLLHDFDYETHQITTPPDGHPYFGTAILKELGYSPEIISAILGHATYTGEPRITLMAKTLFAVDELSGLVTAASLVRPDKSIANLEVNSVMKKFKDKAFARGCNRDDIRLGAEELGIPLDEHIKNIITALS